MCPVRLVLCVSIHQILQFGPRLNPRILRPSGLLQVWVCAHQSSVLIHSLLGRLFPRACLSWYWSSHSVNAMMQHWSSFEMEHLRFCMQSSSQTRERDTALHCSGHAWWLLQTNRIWWHAFRASIYGHNVHMFGKWRLACLDTCFRHHKAFP